MTRDMCCNMLDDLLPRIRKSILSVMNAILPIMSFRIASLWFIAAILFPDISWSDELTVKIDRPEGALDLSLAAVSLFVDPDAAPVVHEAADLLAGDLGRVTGRPSSVVADATHAAILIGTFGDGGPVDKMVAVGRVDLAGVRGQSETFVWQMIDSPFPNVSRALVIVGSDRRGTAYGCTELSKAIGVSPWIWWADVPPQHHDRLTVTAGRHVDGPPGVMYRGIFLNDEDWGLRPWASKTFDPALGNFGPKTYTKLFELMLRLRLNYLWPAMHPGSAEFGSVPGNAEAADRWAIVMGAAHCEPMLRNNVYWNPADGPWRYDVNRDNILRYWTESVDRRGNFEAVWTLGIRGIHDQAMQGPPGIPARVKMVNGIITDQRQLIDAKVTRRYGQPAQCLIPYKEVLPLYDTGLSVPDDVTLVWPDDNFGYIRHLPNAAERRRSGGNGVYYHVSYWGRPQSYLWVESAPLGLVWEELHKAWQNDAGRLWVLNVGDLKPAEIAITFYADLAWSPDQWGTDAQERFLHDFFAATFGPQLAGPMADLQASYYRLATMRRPDQFQFQWLSTLSQADLKDLDRRYGALAEQEAAVAKQVPTDHADAYFEMVGYAARMLADAGRLYLHVQAAKRYGHADDLPAAKQYWSDIVTQTRQYNEQTAGGKWRYMMDFNPQDLTWPTDVGGSKVAPPIPSEPPAASAAVRIDAVNMTAHGASGARKWKPVAGLGYSGRAITVLPATVPDDGDVGATADYAFSLSSAADNSDICLQLLPTMRINPAGRLRVAVAIDDGTPTTYDVPGGTASDENSGPRRTGVIANRVTMPLAAGQMSAGKHNLKVVAIDPGIVLDQIDLPATATVVPP